MTGLSATYNANYKTRTCVLSISNGYAVLRVVSNAWTFSGVTVNNIPAPKSTANGPRLSNWSGGQYIDLRINPNKTIDTYGGNGLGPTTNGVTAVTFANVVTFTYPL